MTKLLLFTSIAIFSIAIVHPEETSRVDRGNAAYEAKNYQAAADAYEAEIVEKGPNADLLYNLGNAHYRLGHYGPSIYAYERALILEPRSSDIQANLTLARKAAAAFEENSNKWLKIFHWFSLNDWFTTGAIALLVLAAISLARAGSLLDKLPLPVRWITIPALGLLTVSIAAVIIRHAELDRAIVVTEGTPVKLSPFATADTKATMKWGETVRIEEEHQGYYRIQNGWVSKENVKPLLTRR